MWNFNKLEKNLKTQVKKFYSKILKFDFSYNLAILRQKFTILITSMTITFTCSSRSTFLHICSLLT